MKKSDKEIVRKLRAEWKNVFMLNQKLSRLDLEKSLGEPDQTYSHLSKTLREISQTQNIGWWGQLNTIVIALKMGNVPWAKKETIKLINMPEAYFLLDDRSSEIDDSFKQKVRSYLQFIKNSLKNDTLFRLLIFKLKTNAFPGRSDMISFEDSFSLAQIREYANSYYWGERFFPIWFELLELRNSLNDGLGLIKKYIDPAFIDEHIGSIHLILKNHIPAKKSVRDHLINVMYRLRSSEKFEDLYVYLNLLEIDVLRDLFFERYPKLNKALFNEKRKILQIMISDSNVLIYPLYNLMKLGDFSLEILEVVKELSNSKTSLK